MDEEKRIQKLIQELGSLDWNLQMSAAIDLSHTRKEIEIPALIEALTDENENVRVAVAYRLGNITVASAVPALIEALKDESKEVREVVVRSLTIILEKCKSSEIFQSIDEVQEFEDNLIRYLADKRKNCTDKRKKREVELLIAKLRMKIAESKNELAEKKDILLPDKPKPPKKGQIFQKMRRVRNG